MFSLMGMEDGDEDDGDDDEGEEVQNARDIQMLERLQYDDNDDNNDDEPKTPMIQPQLQLLLNNIDSDDDNYDLVVANSEEYF